MKKLISLTLAALLLLSLVGCQLKEDTPPAGTTTNTTAAITTQAPVTTTPPVVEKATFLVELRSPSTVGSASWIETLPSTMPTTQIAYETPSVAMAGLLSMTSTTVAQIDSREKLDAYFSRPSQTEIDYDSLKSIDFSTQTVFVITGYHSFIIGAELEQVISHDGALLVSYTTSYAGGVQLSAIERWYDILVVDNVDLPDVEGEIPVYVSVAYPNVTEPDTVERFPSYPQSVGKPQRYVFVPVTAE